MPEHRYCVDQEETDQSIDMTPTFRCTEVVLLTVSVQEFTDVYSHVKVLMFLTCRKTTIQLTLAPISSLLHPQWEVIGVLLRDDELVIVSSRRIDMGNIGVVHHLTPEERNPARAAVGRSGIMVYESRALSHHFTLQNILIIS